MSDFPEAIQIFGIGNNSAKNVFIYRLVDPETRDVHYIGKSVSPYQRLRQHLKEKDSLKSYWIQSLEGKGLEPILEIIEVCPPQKADEVERHWILEYRKSGAKLFNVHPHTFESDGRFEKYYSLQDWDKVFSHARSISRDKMPVDYVLDWCDFAQQNGIDIFCPQYEQTDAFLSTYKDGFREIAILALRFYLKAVFELFPEKRFDSVILAEFLHNEEVFSDDVILLRVIDNIRSKLSNLDEVFLSVDKALINEYALLEEEIEKILGDPHGLWAIQQTKHALYRVAYHYNSLRSRDVNMLKAFFISNGATLIAKPNGNYCLKRDDKPLAKRDALFEDLLNVLGESPTYEHLTSPSMAKWIRKNNALINLYVGSVSTSSFDCIVQCLASCGLELRPQGIAWASSGAVYYIARIEYRAINHVR